MTARLACCALLLISLATEAPAQKNFFYHGRSFGSEALYNPISLVLNSSFDILQLQGHSRSVASFGYAAGLRNVGKNLATPFSSIAENGWGGFLRREVLPLDWSPEGCQWWPNYQLHLIGGGMTYVAMSEWYDRQGFPVPSLFSLGTVAAYHVLNEAVENGTYEGVNTDPIADLLLFDVAGVILFSNASVVRFFSEDLHLADWSFQPSFALPGWNLRNNGQNFIVKMRLPFSQRDRLFYHFGMNGLLGISHLNDDGTSVSFGAGLRAKSLRLVNPSENRKGAALTWEAGVFYDRENSLLASLIVSGVEDYRVNVNLYPGLFAFGAVSPGLWMQVDADWNPTMGITTVWLPGVAHVFQNEQREP